MTRSLFHAMVALAIVTAAPLRACNHRSRAVPMPPVGEDRSAAKIQTPSRASRGPLRSDDPPSPLDRFFGLSCDALSVLKVRSVKCYGARGDGIADDTSAIERAMGGRGPAFLLFPPGTYGVSKALRPLAPKWLGAPSHLGTTTIKVSDSVTTPLDAVVDARGSAVFLKNITIDANEKARTALIITRSHGPNTVVEDVTVKDALEDGLHCEHSMSGLLKRILAEGNARHGVRMSGCNNEAVLDLTSRNNGGDGLVIERTARPSGGLYVWRGEVTDNGGRGITVTGVGARTAIVDLFIRSNDDGVSIADGAQGVAVVGNRIEKGPHAGPAARAVRIESTVTGDGTWSNVVQDNRVSEPAPGSGDRFATIEVAAPGNFVVGNGFVGEDFVPVPVSYTARNVVAFMESDEFRRAPLRFDSGGDSRTVRYASRPPSRARAGDLILNASGSAPFGWQCIPANHSACQWRALGGASDFKERLREP